MKQKKNWQTPVLMNLLGKTTEAGGAPMPGTEGTHTVGTCPFTS